MDCAGFRDEMGDLTPLFSSRSQCNGDNGLYVSSYYSTEATRQISQHEKSAVEFLQRPFHVFASIGITTFKYTLISSMVPH